MQQGQNLHFTAKYALFYLETPFPEIINAETHLT